MKVVVLMRRSFHPALILMMDHLLYIILKTCSDVLPGGIPPIHHYSIQTRTPSFAMCHAQRKSYVVFSAGHRLILLFRFPRPPGYWVALDILVIFP
jgi:hypothetical protein